MLPGFDISEVLYEGSDYCIFRGHDVDERSRSLLIKALKPELTTSRAIASLHAEHELMLALTGPHLVRPMAVFKHGSITLQLLPDPGGRTLARAIGPGNCALDRFFDLALALTEALVDLHAQQLVHGDLQPGQILVDTADGIVRLIGFRLATRAPRSHVSSARADLAVHALPYMSPEQTGRMNRAVDSRADLYTLGVLLYELLTGQRPFNADDPLEWVHCHVAREPPKLDEISPEAPSSLHLILQRLLKKLPEARYQTAAGVRHDLLVCARQWRSSGTVMPFPLGSNDIAEAFQLSEKLVGRQLELQVLLDAFALVAADAAPQVVLLRGPAGAGKSTLAAQALKEIGLRGGLAAGGKADQYPHDIPHAPLRDALASLVQRILLESAEQLDFWKTRLDTALGMDAGALVDLVPILQKVLGNVAAPAPLPPVQAERRLQSALRRFLGVFAGADRPLVLFFDDLQWMDDAATGLVISVFESAPVKHVLLLVTCRDGVERDLEPMHAMAEQFAAMNICIRELRLPPLDQADVSVLIADTVGRADEDTRELAAAVLRKTAGNPHFIGRFITALHQDGVLNFNHELRRWEWDAGKVARRDYADSVVELMRQGVQQMPPATRHLLGLAGLLGQTFSLERLSLIDAGTPESIEARLRPAIEVGFIARNEWQSGQYRFLHDNAREAVCSIWHASERIAQHLRIGWALAARLSDEPDEQLYAAVTHLDEGASLATAGERLRIAALNLRAAAQAFQSTAYRAAARYLDAGISLLPAGPWAETRELASALHRMRAHCYNLELDHARAEQVAMMVLSRVPEQIDRLDAYEVLIDACVARAAYERAEGVLLTSLRELGIDVPQRPPIADVRREWHRLHAEWRGRSAASQATLPPMVDAVALLKVRGINSALRLMVFFDKNLLALLQCRIVDLMLQHGQTVEAAAGLSYFGWIVAFRFGDLKSAEEFGEWAERMTRAHAGHRDAGRVVFWRGLAAYWSQPLEVVIRRLEAAYVDSIRVGDLATASFACGHLATIHLLRGKHLDEFITDVDEQIEFVKRAGYSDLEHDLETMSEAARLLMGRCSESRIDRRSSGPDSPAVPDESGLRLSMFWIRRLQVYCVLGDRQRASAASARVRGLLAPVMGTLLEYNYVFFSALVHIDEAAGSDDRVESFIDDCVASIDRWAAGNPATFGIPRELIHGALAGRRGDAITALQHYERACQSALDRNWPHFLGMAHERAARLGDSLGLREMARSHLSKAREAYQQWGALVKVRQLDESDAAPPPSASGPTQHLAAIGEERLDALAIVKASQAISSVLQRDSLLSTLMRLVMEYAAATSGTFLLVDGGDGSVMRVAVTAHVEGQTIDVDVASPDESASGELDASDRVPRSLVAYVQRSGMEVLLSSSNQRDFARDPYFAARSVASALCMPILRLSQMVGILYVEHREIPDLFTIDRVALLRQLSTQIAISLENSQIYEQLRRLNVELETRIAARTDALKAATREAERANRAKSQFLSSMSHELRTPMNAIIGLSRLALDTGLDTRQRSYIDRVHAAAKRLLTLLNAILDFSKIEAEKLDIEHAEFRLDDVIEQVVDIVGLRAEEKGIRLLFDSSRSLPARLVGDPLRLGQVLINLCGNAVKFTEQGEVVCTIEQIASPPGQSQSQSQSLLQFSVRDTGIGIDPALRERLFKPFSQIDGSTTRKHGGTGLGLSISKRLVELMGGDIRVRSALGAGCTFSFTLPFDIVAEEAPATNLGQGRRALVWARDDEERGILVRRLAELGFETTSADTVPTPDSHALTLVHLDRAGELAIQAALDRPVGAGRAVIGIGSALSDALHVDAVMSRPWTSASLYAACCEALHAGSISRDRTTEEGDSSEPSPARGRDLAGLRVLVAEDDEVNQFLASAWLQAVGIDADIVANGAEALERLEDACFDVVLMDCNMPVMDGFEAVRLLRERPALLGLPVIAMTASATTEDRNEALASGMNDFVSKPIDVQLLYETIQRWAMRRQDPTRLAS